jgi:MoaA/NifB/PqqE/SkfB family radical SAM enzyme
MGEGGRNRLSHGAAVRGLAETRELKRNTGKDAGPPLQVKVGRDGRLHIPREIARKLGADPGRSLDLAVGGGKVEILPDVHSLAKVYIEPTSRCNLTCETCIRRTWDEPLGDMDGETFEALFQGLRHIRHLETVMFGGFGEPTAHPEILSMIAKVKSLGVRAEMTTNGTCLDEDFLQGLFKSRLDTLWVSLDGTKEASYEDIRAGASFRKITESLRRLQEMNAASAHQIKVGIAFVLMRRNIRDLKTMDDLARSVGADVVMVSHVLPYRPEMEAEMLCRLTLSLETFASVPEKTVIHLPRMDVNVLTSDTILHLLQGFENLTMMGNKIAADTHRCRFIYERCTFIRWDGKVAPCMGLLHAHTTYLYGYERRISPHLLGDVRETPLSLIWRSKVYREFREDVKAFNYSPCHLCGGCDLLKENKEDCLGHTFPVCGGCLWAEGVIQCP